MLQKTEERLSIYTFQLSALNLGFGEDMSDMQDRKIYNSDDLVMRR